MEEMKSFLLALAEERIGELERKGLLPKSKDVKEKVAKI